VDIRIEHPFMMIFFRVDGTRNLQPVRLYDAYGPGFRAAETSFRWLVVPPLTFLGGSFYSIKMLPPFWQA